ncbi:hypothetical protein H5410_013485 [Solanum commersonii]|uniref:ATP-dependent DNA helicase n=1 Tax=Solanum commersonii TaxID=4109 RepID=A0A9J6AVI4_SOLCO|nr:hypothetical protein H5410_013485 [Solanum commersonii]
MCAKKDPAFCAYLMRIGNGQEKTNNYNKIEILNNFIIPFTHEIEYLNLLFNVTYPDFRTFYSNPSFITSHIILITKNDFVDEINDMLIHGFPDNAIVYTTIDETIEPNDQCQFEDFLHTLHPINLPPYRLTLKKFVHATISSGDFKNKHLNKHVRTVMKLLDGQNCESWEEQCKESHDAREDSQDLLKEFKQAATPRGNESNSCCT